MMPTTKDVPVHARAGGSAARGGPAGFQAIRDEIDRMFHALSLPEMNWRSGLPGPSGSIGLRVDVAETEDAIQVTAELPGVAEEDVDVSLEDDLLRIRAEKRSDTERDDRTWHVVERSYGTFERAIRLPPGIDPERVAANFTNGVLTVSLPKPPEAVKTARRIEISAG